MFLSQALSAQEQLRVAHECLCQHSRAAHTNLTNLGVVDPAEQKESLWESFCRSKDSALFGKLRWSSLGY